MNHNPHLDNFTKADQLKIRHVAEKCDFPVENLTGRMMLVLIEIYDEVNHVKN